MPRAPGLIRPAGCADHDTILALNRQHEAETSALDAASLRQLMADAFRVYVAAEGTAGFLIALDQDAAYDSPNFLWFRARQPRFVYVDRVITAAAARGQGWARRLYETLFAEAHAAGHSMICCEVNSNPPNPASDAFHLALDFAAVGQASIHGGSKTVTYLARSL